jgi:hypothetical protein
VLDSAQFKKLFSMSHNGWLNFRQLPVAKTGTLIPIKDQLDDSCSGQNQKVYLQRQGPGRLKTERLGRFFNPAAFFIANPPPDSGEASFHQDFAGPATFVLVPGFVTIRLAHGRGI